MGRVDLTPDPNQVAIQNLLRRQFGGGPYSLAPLHHNGTNAFGFVFRADIDGGETVVAKCGDPARMAIAAERLTQTYPRMCEGRFRVPQLLAHDGEAGVLIMEDARGQSAQVLWLSGDAGAQRALLCAGAWIARFHKSGAHMAAFNPDPHLNWLRKQVATHQQTGHEIPEFNQFRQIFAHLEKTAEAARGQPILRCVTHRDFHLRNLLIRKLGRIYGIDFENAKRDEALRDLLFFTADAAKLQITAPKAESLRATATALRAAYGRSLGNTDACCAFQRAFALAGWAALDQGTRPLGPNRQRQLDVMQLIATTDDLFADP